VVVGVVFIVWRDTPDDVTKYSGVSRNGGLIIERC